MKILFVAPTEPTDTSFGGALRTSDLAFALGRSGQLHTLVVQGGPVAKFDAEWSATGTRRATYSVQGGPLRRVWHRLRARRRIAALIAAEGYDVIVARYVGQAIFVPWSSWRRLVIDPDDICKSVEPTGVAMANRIKTSLRNAIVAWLLRRASHVWIVNPQDATRLRAPRMSMLGNVIHVPEETSPPAAVPRRILMVGYFRHEPNASGLRWFASEVLPLLTRHFPDIRLHAVGKCPDGFDQGFAANVVIRGFVEDLAAEYRHAEMVIAPIASGGGSQIKVIEALAHRRPLVASRFSSAAFADKLKSGEHLMSADTAIEWQAACLSTLSDPVRADEIALCGHCAVRAHYGIDGMLAEVTRTLAEYERGTAV
ncbi:MAG: glycosyltransferase [Pseudomonadota bacterium]